MSRATEILQLYEATASQKIRQSVNKGAAQKKIAKAVAAGALPGETISPSKKAVKAKQAKSPIDRFLTTGSTDLPKPRKKRKRKSKKSRQK